jgi:hypothetical protein
VRIAYKNPEKEQAMAKFAIGERVEKATDDHKDGVVIAIFPTTDGNFRYAVDMEGYGALQFFAEEKLVVCTG